MNTNTVIFYFLGFLLYFLPTFMAWKTKYVSGIFILNLFLGWTLIGWIIALIWAVSAPKENKNQNNSKRIDWRKGFSDIKNRFFINSKPYESEEVLQFSLILNEGEAIIKNKSTNQYEIVTAEQWENILIEKKENEYEIIEEK